MAVSVLGREELGVLETMIRSRFESVVNKHASVPEYRWAFAKYGNRVGMLARQVLGAASKTANGNAGAVVGNGGAPVVSGFVGRSAQAIGEMDQNELPISVFIEPIKEERYFDFQFFVPEQDKEFWREKTAGYWSHIIGHEGRGSLLSLLKKKGLATALSSGMYYDGGGTGVFR